MRLSQ